MPEPTRSTSRRLLILAAKVAVAGLVVWFVGGAVLDAARELSSHAIRPHAGMLALSGLVYLVALLPMAWFWRQTLRALGQPCAWAEVLPAYYLGHLGKYVPGKAMVVVLRTGAIRRAGGRAAPIAASAFVETLTMMSVGGVLACALLLTLSTDGARPAWLAPLSLGLAALAATPTFPPVMRTILKRLTPDNEAAVSGERLTWPLLGVGWAAATVTWIGLAASLWLAIRSIDNQIELSSETALRCLLAVSLPVVAGFLSLIPGGLLVRDGLMFALLKPLAALAEPTALAATVLVRLIWVVTELVACGIMVLACRVFRTAD